jgi:hypothetical protein
MDHGGVETTEREADPKNKSDEPGNEKMVGIKNRAHAGQDQKHNADGKRNFLQAIEFGDDFVHGEFSRLAGTLAPSVNFAVSLVGTSASVAFSLNCSARM